MAIDYNLLRTLSPEDGMAYLRQALAGGMGDYVPGTEGSGSGEAAVPGEAGYYSGLGRGTNVIQGWEGYGQQSEYDGVAPGTRRTNQAIIEGPGGRSYVATFDQDGKLTDVGRQMADSWYDKEVGGVPLGAFLPVAAAAAAAYGPALFNGSPAGGAGATGMDFGAAFEAGTAPGMTGPGTAGFGGAEINYSFGDDFMFGQDGLLSEVPEGVADLGELGYNTSAPPEGVADLGELGYNTGLPNGANGAPYGASPTVGPGASAGSGPWSAIKSGVGAVADAVGGGKNLAGIVGAVVGAATSRSGNSTSTAQREPWQPAQQWMKDNITEGQRLQQQYKDNPFNDVQLAGYRNLLSGIDNFNSSTAPGLMNWANGWMGGSRDFDPAAAIRSSPFAGGLLSQQPGNASGRPAAAPGGPFSAPQHSPYQGLLQDTLRWPAQQPPPSSGGGRPPGSSGDVIGPMVMLPAPGGGMESWHQRYARENSAAPAGNSSVNTTYSSDIMGRGAAQPAVFSPLGGGSASMVLPGGGGPAGGLDYLRALGMGRR